ncbi:MAG: phage terminase large subunit [Hyphomicrobiaceae bacterium]
MPPRSGKSELASKRFPAFFLGAHPHRNIIAASYNSDLATDFGREVRNMVRSRPYQALFATTLAEDSTAANRWHTEEGGMYVAAGVGTATTGRGAHVLLIDDPFKDREEADSEVIREKKWRWYTSTAYTRLESDIVADVTEDDALWRDLTRDIAVGDAKPFEGAIVLINTRWHEDDLSGRLLAAEASGGDRWEVLDLPAISADGKALWPEKFPLERLHQIRNAIGERDWSALYQQRPAPDEGAYFKRDWFKTYDTAPKHLRIYGASDYAVTKEGGDFTVHIVVGVDPDDNIYILDIWRGQELTDVSVDVLCKLIKDWRPMMWAEDRDQIVTSIGPFINKRMQELKTFCRREQFAFANRDKPMRARAIQARASMGKVYLPATAAWKADFLSELLMFDAGRFDDQVDTFGLVGRMLDDMVGARAPKNKKVSQRRDYGQAMRSDGESWRMR